MIYISHNYKDKSAVEPVANRLLKIYGTENVSFDAWTMQPGDGVLFNASGSLAGCRFFLFFVTENSLQSNMLSLEWQNVVLKAAAWSAMLIPVRLDDCVMPPVFLQNLYIDLFRYGSEVGFRQIIDVIEGTNAFRNPNREFSNLKAYTYIENGKTIIECHAEHYLEPISSYLIILSNKEEEVYYESRTPFPTRKSFTRNITLGNGSMYNAIHMASDKATAPGFPFIFELSPINESIIRLICVMQEVKASNWKAIPTVFGKKKE